ncbi:C-reactive protein-like isoform X2 [Xenopus laevis]|uniref:Pentraxin family member n=1 Tax=Xenopus laevis TaxID=8355 RepID=A0A8J1LMC6_XENLA|nr:C-reactive protein-like isoform X2 [Xenopus laevis]XP_041430361.1 C-reactive protein-like isoform X2 [Xenopus laevis]
MKMRVLCLLLFAGSMAQEDMDRNVFLFPSKTVDDYVVLTPMVTEPLDKLTVCLRSYTDGGRYALFSVGTRKSKIRKIFVIVQDTSHSYPTIYINNTQVSIPAKADVLEWNHYCVTWDSNTGVLQLWVNGKVSLRKILKKGYSIDLQDGISLGQMQRDYWEELDPDLSFEGEISDVHMWNEVLSPKTIRRVLLNNREINGNVISWRSLNYTINGDVIVQPKLQCRFSTKSGSSRRECSIN